MRRTAHRNGSQPHKGTGELRVTSDLTPATPISEAELAALEAFLWTELRELLGDDPPPQKESAAGGANSADLCHNDNTAAPTRPHRKSA
jgi:hypothetical protein